MQGEDALLGTEVHEQDHQCTVGSRGYCIYCGVDHNVEPCVICGGRGFHKFECCMYLEELE